MTSLPARRRALFFVLCAAVAAHQLLAGSATGRAGSTADLYRGVSLEDLATANEEEVSPSLERIAPLVREYVAVNHDLALKKILSISLHQFNRDARTMTVDILGRDKSFATVDHDGLGGLGFIRVEIHFETNPGNPTEVTVFGHKILMSRDWSELNPHVTSSLGQRLAAIEDDETGFRRLFPLDVGSIDDVHYKGVTTVMTPVTELSVLDKNTTFRHRTQPKNYRGKPFIPLNVPLEAPGTTAHARYRTTAIAFHIWQSPKFQRGFVSHGCMRMREGDLDEMLAFVEGVKGTIPVKVRIAKIEGAEHPFPAMTDRFNAVQNFGTKEQPVARKLMDEDGVRLTKTHTVKGEPPAIETLTGMTIDPAPMGPVPGAMYDSENQIRDKDD